MNKWREILNKRELPSIDENKKRQSIEILKMEIANTEITVKESYFEKIKRYIPIKICFCSIRSNIFFRVCILFDYIYFFSFRWYFIQKMAKSQAKIKEIYYGSSDFSQFSKHSLWAIGTHSTHRLHLLTRWILWRRRYHLERCFSKLYRWF